MPCSLQIRFKGDKEKKHGFFMSSIMHGALMDLIEASYAEKLHQNEMHPLSQYVIAQDDELVWTVNCLTQEAEDKILHILQNDNFVSLRLNHREETLQVIEKNTRRISFQDLINQYYFSQKKNLIKIRFVTPTSFKSAGSYCIFPSVRLIFQSLMLKYDAVSEENHIFSEELLGHYEKYAHITGYRLKSTMFHMEGTRIPSFQGEVSIRIHGPQQMINMAWMLAEFGTYSGVGIKTSLGMGGMEILNDKQQEKGEFF